MSLLAWQDSEYSMKKTLDLGLLINKSVFFLIYRIELFIQCKQFSRHYWSILYLYFFKMESAYVEVVDDPLLLRIEKERGSLICARV